MHAFVEAEGNNIVAFDRAHGGVPLGGACVRYIFDRTTRSAAPVSAGHLGVCELSRVEFMLSGAEPLVLHDKMGYCCLQRR